MLRKIKVSVINPIQFIPAGIERAVRYNTNNPYTSWFSETIRPWETPVEYVQKIQKTDPLNIQIRFTLLNTENLSSSDAQLFLYRCTGELVDSRYFSLPALAPPVLYDDGEPFRLNGLNVPDYFASLDEGRYYMVIRVPFGFPVAFTDEWISEPIEIRNIWEDTILIEYSNTENTLDVIFEQFRQTFAFRIEGALIKPKDYVNRVTAQDQAAKTIPLSADAYAGITFAAGGNGQFIPDWAFKKLNNIFTLDVIRMDGVLYTANQGASIERQYIPDYPLFSGEIDLVEGDPDKAFMFSKGSMLIFTRPIGTYVIMNIRIGYQDFYILQELNPALISTLGALDAYIVALNTAIALAGLTGTVTRVGDDVFYTLGASEDFDAAEALILDQFFSIRNVVSFGGNAETEIKLSGTDGNNAPYYVTGISDYPYGYLPDELTTINLNGVGVVPGTYFNSVFHNGLIGQIIISGLSVSDFLGATDFPENLRLFSMVDCNKISQFNIGMLDEARENIEFINLETCASLEVVGGYYPNLPWLKLKLLNVTGTVMSTSDVNALLDEFDLAMGTGNQVVYNGSMDLSGQTPAAPPSGPALATIASLEDIYNWTVTTD